MKKIKEFLKPLMTEYGGWQIAIREKKGANLYEGNVKGFQLVQNTFRYWLADPFLFEYEGKNYLFAEMFDRIRWRGIIGYAEITEGKKIKFRPCMIKPFHLSYPCLFSKNNVIYMVPEAYQSGKITVYRAVKFPIKWEVAYEIDNIEAVDTTPLIIEGKLLGFFTTIGKEKQDFHRFNNNLYFIKDGERKLLYKDNLKKRSAGNIISEKNQIVRPSQDCTVNYGGGLLFNSGIYENGTYKEKSIVKIVPFQTNKKNDNEYKLELETEPSLEFYGIHTYNKNNKYEVIDLTYREKKNFLVFLHNFGCYLQEKVRKLKGYRKKIY